MSTKSKSKTIDLTEQLKTKAGRDEALDTLNNLRLNRMAKEFIRYWVAIQDCGYEVIWANGRMADTPIGMKKLDILKAANEIVPLPFDDLV